MSHRYDSDQDGRLSFWELFNIFMPSDLRLQLTIEQRHPATLSTQTQQTMRAVLQTVIATEERVERIRLGLRKTTANTRQIFERLDYMDRGQLTERELYRFLEKHPSPEQLYEQERGQFS